MGQQPRASNTFLNGLLELGCSNYMSSATWARIFLIDDGKRLLFCRNNIQLFMIVTANDFESWTIMWIIFSESGRSWMMSSRGSASGTLMRDLALRMLLLEYVEPNSREWCDCQLTIGLSKMWTNQGWLHGGLLHSIYSDRPICFRWAMVKQMTECRLWYTAFFRTRLSTIAIAVLFCEA